MKKLILSIGIAVFAFPVKTSAQVGINTTTPTATLDITAKNTAGNSSNVDGLLIPRVDRQRAQSMTSVPTSTLVYINSITTGSQTGTAINIDATGYYYYNGTAWAKFNSSAPAITNIYNADGSLTGNRTVTHGNNTLAFKANSVNAFSVNNAFSVDAANNRVGIGTTAPQTKLDINTVTDSYGLQITNGTISLRGYIGSNGNNNAAAIGTYSNHPFDLVTNNSTVVRITPNRKVGIGTDSPGGTLTVSGSGSGTTPILSLINTNVAGNPVLNIYPGFTSNGNSIAEGNSNGVVFDQDPGASTGSSQSLYDFHGQIRSVSSSTLSDIRLKENIEDFNQYGLSEILKIQPRKYILKEYGTPDVGVIAQELKAIIPELVYGDESKGLLSVDYSKISLVLINAIKEQEKKIEELQSEIKLLKSHLSSNEKK